MNKREQRELIRNFKPQFGNVNHIHAIEIIDKIKKRDAVERRRDEAQDELEELDEELEREARNLKHLIEN